MYANVVNFAIPLNVIGDARNNRGAMGSLSGSVAQQHWSIAKWGVAME
jgi:hypothetical protein